MKDKIINFIIDLMSWFRGNEPVDEDFWEKEKIMKSIFWVIMLIIFGLLHVVGVLMERIGLFIYNRLSFIEQMTSGMLKIIIRKANK